MSGYIRVGTDVKNDVKVLNLAELLGLRSYAAVGLLTLLGAWVERYQGEDCFDRLPKSAICEAVGWNRSADRLFRALEAAGIYKEEGGREYLDLGGLTLSKAEAERAAARQRMRNLRVKRSACACEKEEDTEDKPVKPKTLTGINIIDEDEDELLETDWGSKRGEKANKNRTNDALCVRSAFGNGEGPSLSPPSSPHTPYYSSHSLPSKKNKKNNNKAAAAAEGWEAVFEEELCPLGEVAREKICSYIARGAEEELIREAIREAALSGARSPKYLFSILDRCVDSGIFTKESFLWDLGSRRDKRPRRTYGSGEITERELLTISGFDY